MKGNSVFKIPGLIPEHSRYYYFHVDLVCRQFLLPDFNYAVQERSLRAAWRKLRTQVQDYIKFMGFQHIVVERIFFRSCDVFDLDGKFLKTYNKIN